MLRKVFALVVVGAFSLVLAGCGGGDSKTKTPAKTGDKTAKTDAPKTEAPKTDAPAAPKTDEAKTPEAKTP